MALSVGIIGASGYSGAELLRILAGHSGLEVSIVTASAHAGQCVGELYPHLQAYSSLRFYLLEDARRELDDCDVLFCGLPHGAAMRILPEFNNRLIVDLGGDFRLQDAETYANWYGMAHAAEDKLSEWVYGLPELYRERIAGAKRIANPGCYATAIILAMAPLLQRGLVRPLVVADAVSGLSGAGRGLKDQTHFAHASEDVRAYKVCRHQHTPEIEMACSDGLDEAVKLSLTAHLAPMVRGIHATCSAELVDGVDAAQVIAALEGAYTAEAFVTVTEDPPGTKQVRGSNHVLLSAQTDVRTGRVIVMSVLDNLVKGAAGQALQNANIALGLSETEGLEGLALYP